MDTNRAKALNHVNAVRACRDRLNELHLPDAPRRPGEVGSLNAELGTALKLAEVHATLAAADETRELAEAVRDIRDLLADWVLEPPAPRSLSEALTLVSSPPIDGTDHVTGYVDDLPIPLKLDVPAYDYLEGRDCTCDPRHLEVGGYDSGCPKHDVLPGEVCS